MDRSKSLLTVFRDFLTLSTFSLAQPFYRSDEIEQKYLNIIKTYSKEQAEEFSKLLALLVSALEVKHQDFLGEVYMRLNFGSMSKGQYFTPYPISKMMAEINFENFDELFKEKDFISLLEPCCGSGGMIIASAETMLAKGYNYQHQLYVEAIDVDEICFKMCYVQLSLLGIPAKVVWGDSISMKTYEVLYTPFYFLSDFQRRIEEREQINKMRSIFAEEHKEEPQGDCLGGQLKFFNF